MGLSSSDFAKILGKSSVTISEWRSAGKLILDDDGSINAEKSLDLLRGPTRKGGARAAPAPSADGGMRGGNLPVGEVGELSLAEASRRKENYAAGLQQLKFDIEKKKVVVIDDVMPEFTKELASIRAALLALPARIAPRAVVMKSAEEARDFIEEEIRLALSFLSK